MKIIVFISFLFIPIVFFGQFSGKKILSQTEIKRPYCIDAADLDSDGDKDIVVCGYDTTKLYWFENLGNNSFSRQQEIYSSTSNAGMSIKVCDLNNDYTDDIIFVTSLSTYLFFNDGTGNFSYNILNSNGGQGAIVNAADFDNDNDIDILLSGYSKIRWFINDGYGNFTLGDMILPIYNSYNPVELFDLTMIIILMLL